MAEFLNNVITLIFFVWLLIISKRIDILDKFEYAHKEAGLMLAKEIDRLRARIAELEKDGDNHEG